MTPNPKIHHMSRLYFFMKLYFMNYIKDVVIPDTIKHPNSSMNLSDYFHVIGYCLIMDCYVGHSVRDFFLKGPITPQKGAPIRLNNIIFGRSLGNTAYAMSYTYFTIPECGYPLLQQWQMEEGWNSKTAEIFDPLWVSVLDESIQEWIDRYT